MKFRDAARILRSRWFVCRLMDAIGRALAPFSVFVVVALFLCSHFGVRMPYGGVALALHLVFIAALALRLYLRRPDYVSVMALWDEICGRKEVFVSALVFEEDGAAREGERLHIAKAARELDSELAKLGSQMPVRMPYHAFALAAIVVTFSFTQYLTPLIPQDELPLDELARQEAMKEGKSLAKKAKGLDELKELDDEKKEDIDKLQKLIEETAKKIEKLEKNTPRDVLEELENMAREAEKLADGFADSEGGGLSSDMIAEMERHADTAALAAALRAKDLEKTETEASKIADKLEGDSMNMEQEERLRRALRSSLDKANDEDKKSVPYKHMDDALKHLNKSRQHHAKNEKEDAKKERQLAGKDFRNMQNQYKTAAQRKKALKRLQRLAQALRKSGSNIAGNKNSGLKRLAKLGKSGSGQSQSGSQRRLVRNMPLKGLNNLRGLQSGKYGSGKMPTSSGLSKAPTSGGMPVPGTGSGSGMGNTPIPGAGNQPGGSGGAPVPGAGQGAGKGNGAGQGGLQAGTGTAPYGTTKTNPYKTDKTGVVAGKTGEGPAMVRTVEGGKHEEDSVRGSNTLTANFINAEEEALSDEQLPLSRREQVLKYFGALRKQVTDEQGEDK
ncbi:MAG: hypothetical protein JXR97_16440 [Planctomycetes bacterium]|nr:hypothetical protein [Planctomycetota bacterium]